LETPQRLKKSHANLNRFKKQSENQVSKKTNHTQHQPSPLSIH
jgi:hypothetical protein